MTHTATLTIPANCTAQEYEELLRTVNITFKESINKSEHIEKDLLKIRGKTVKLFSDDLHVLHSYVYNIPDRIEEEEEDDEIE